jgi:hypothetical protein
MGARCSHRSWLLANPLFRSHRFLDRDVLYAFVSKWEDARGPHSPSVLQRIETLGLCIARRLVKVMQAYQRARQTKVPSESALGRNGAASCGICNGDRHCSALRLRNRSLALVAQSMRPVITVTDAGHSPTRNPAGHALGSGVDHGYREEAFAAVFDSSAEALLTKSIIRSRESWATPSFCSPTKTG